MTRVALVQVASPGTEPPAARLERVGRMVADAAGADLVMLPELWLPGYFAFDRYAELAEPLDGDTVAAGREWAANLNCFVHLGSIVERTPEGRLHNTAVLIDPRGTVVHTYRKIHVFGYRSREAQLLTPGADVGVATSPLGAMGATTCYDLRFPELWRDLLDAGAEAVAVPAAWPAARRGHWRLFTTARAVEEQVLVAACNAAGTQDGTELAGASRVVDPWGTVLAEGGTGEEIVWCDADPAVVAKTREEFPVLRDRRP
ncbi:nitrilase-related carbon-nitrogen hydrolase [Actinomadura rubrisoli]|uniref:Carbon-nitrogen family hydrolase n=1 Tax=Actinomadura rubrisoli TaxID=2530368 RepID=A0A4R5BGX0_9ACTN|nr:nitrilase-related carbon-nitrogen hydrolase [Actinomadura rubrisoli]TDD85918.1 carbon-nitrogen family hydrolase [Actinomadura rubrisoli]